MTYQVNRQTGIELAMTMTPQSQVQSMRIKPTEGETQTQEMTYRVNQQYRQTGIEPIMRMTSQSQVQSIKELHASNHR